MTEREIARKKAAARKARKERERKARNRRVLLTVCLMLAVCVGSIGGTIAWLQDSSDAVTNTFAPSGIDIDLKEHQYDATEDVLTSTEVTANNNYKLVPGKVYPKNPYVTVKAATDVPVYLFVQVDEGDCKTYLDYQLAWEYTGDDETKKGLYNGWTKLTGEDVGDATVYYRIVNPKTPAADQTWKLIVDDQVTVKSTLLKADDDETTLSMPSNNQTMTFTACAIQSDNLPFAENADENAKALTAWNLAKSTGN